MPALKAEIPTVAARSPQRPPAELRYLMRECIVRTRASASARQQPEVCKQPEICRMAAKAAMRFLDKAASHFHIRRDAGEFSYETSADDCGDVSPIAERAMRERSDTLAVYPAGRVQRQI